MCVFVCPLLRLLITSGVIWNPYNWLSKLYSCYMATVHVVVIINGCGLGIGMQFTATVVKSSCTRVTRWSDSVIRVGVAYVSVYVSRRLKKAGLGYRYMASAYY